MSEKPDLDIALVGPAYPYRGGIAAFNEKMHAGLSARGYAVDVYTFSRQYPGLLFPGKTQERTDPSGSARTFIRSIDSVNPLTWFTTARQIADRQPQLVVFQHWMPFFGPAFGVVARRLRHRGISSIVVVHNAIPHERRPGDRVLTRYLLSVPEGFVTLSQKVTDDLIALGCQQPIRRVEHPIYDHFGPAMASDEARARLGLPLRVPILLFFGFIRRYKGLHTLLAAMPAIVKADATIQLVVAGEFYEDEAPFRKQIEDLGLSEHVHLFAQYIPDEEVSAFFSAADVVVQPYVSATQSGVAQIAFAFDRPVITTNVGGLAETVVHEQTGLLVEPESPGALAKAVVAFFETEVATGMAAAIAGDRERFGWSSLLDAVEELAGLQGPGAEIK